VHLIIFYRDRRGNSPVKDYLNELDAKGGKDARIKRTKRYVSMSRRLRLTGRIFPKSIVSE